jgi:splicing factor 3A subunit 3
MIRIDEVADMKFNRSSSFSLLHNLHVLFLIVDTKQIPTGPAHMFTSLEQKRKLAEDFESIELAIVKRLRANPNIYTPRDGKLDHDILGSNRFISASTTKLQEHEVKKLTEKYFKQRQTLLWMLQDEDTKLQDLSVLRKPEFENGDFSKLIQLCEDAQREIADAQRAGEQDVSIDDHDIYNMFSSNANYDELKHKINELEDPENLLAQQLKPKRTLKKMKAKLANEPKCSILSEFASELKLSQLFTPLECQGTQLDVKNIYTKWLSLPRYKPMDLDKIPTYRTFLQNIESRDGNVRIASDDYISYLSSLQSYLESYYRRANPLTTLDDNTMVKHIDSALEFKHEKLFCMKCNKLFAKDTVFNAHLTGKKHINADKNEKIREILLKECAIANHLTKYLAPQLELTINELSRVELLTVRERELEKREYKPEISSDVAPLSLFFGYETGTDTKEPLEAGNGGLDGDGDGNDDEDEEEFDEKLYNPLNLPIGPDGRPMPFWLWKLKGLGHEFHCDLCNERFQGRAAYEKHFRGSKHIDGLKKLGVTQDFELFNDLNEKQAVLELLEGMKKKIRDELQFVDNTEQVEDEEGNAMSRKVFEQLKKQGLL